MDKYLYDLKKIVYNLESGYFKGREVGLLDNLIVTAQNMKDKYTAMQNAIYFNDNIQLEKISQEKFLYKPVMSRNYYEGDYLERFGETRTSDLKSCKLLEIHNQFWKAYEVQKGNIFASIPKELATLEQSQRLESLEWDEVEVNVYEVKKCNLNKKDFTKYIEKVFRHHILVLEVYSNVIMVLEYNLK
ncbi:hypothetical protein [Alkaliphilus sp. B6464]|uniref:hypothetical protein n=1 Tax=Alkaliphilus sp. B6464 TaxID=2731219 RepID=UPI001BABE64A|nr:hypothetical protein [Alkaliphilus sp. B6464]QUH21184.1 hypothetical protein HYG84_15695 [Alkaliphilus sp. B6464]